MGLFGRAENRKLAKDVRGDSLRNARQSARKLNADFNRAKTHQGKLSVFHSTLEEANRLEVIRRTRATHEVAKRSLRAREAVFRAAYRKMGRKL